MKTTMKETDSQRWELSTFKAHSGFLVSTITRWSKGEHGIETFSLFADSKTLSRVPCSRATQRAITAAHEAAKQLVGELS